MSGYLSNDFHTTDTIIPTELSFSDSFKTLGDYRIKTLKYTPQNGTVFGLGQEVQIQIPAMDRSFIDPRNTFMRCVLSVPTTGHGATFQWKGGFASLIQTQETYINNTSVRSSYVAQYNMLFNLLKNWTTNRDKQESQMILLGTDDNQPFESTWGYTVEQPADHASTNSRTLLFDCYIPWMGEYATNSFVPCFNSSHMIINHLVSSLSDFMIKVSGANGNFDTNNAPFITHCELHVSTLTLNIPDFTNLMQMYVSPETGLGSLPIRTTAYDYFASNLMTAGTTSASLNIPSTVRSARRFFIKFTPAGTPLNDAPLGGINCNATSIYLRLNGENYPHTGINTMTNPLSAYIISQQAFANLLGDSSITNSFSREAYLRTDSLPANANSMASQLYNTAATEQKSNCWSIVLDCESLGAPRAGAGVLMGVALNNSASSSRSPVIHLSVKVSLRISGVNTTVF